MRIRGWLIALCVMALMVGAFYGAATLNARQAAQEQRALLEDAITRALVTCYAVEGRYPSSLSYLEENYGVDVDEETYAVFFTSFADNVLPLCARGGEGRGGERMNQRRFGLRAASGLSLFLAVAVFRPDGASHGGIGRGRLSLCGRPRRGQP